MKTRRQFLFQAAEMSVALAGATAGIYAIGLVSKRFDGSVVAGAKTWQMKTSGGTTTFGCGNSDYSCPPSIGSCTTAGASVIVSKCGCASKEWMNARYVCE